MADVFEGLKACGLEVTIGLLQRLYSCCRALGSCQLCCLRELGWRDWVADKSDGEVEGRKDTTSGRHREMMGEGKRQQINQKDARMTYHAIARTDHHQMIHLIGKTYRRAAAAHPLPSAAIANEIL